MQRLIWGFLILLNSIIVYAKPTVYLLATGGTIAASANSQIATTYTAGNLSAKQLIASVPGLSELAEIKYTQVYNKDSGNITLSDWLNLAQQVSQAVNDPAINAVVITHGSDTLEETAYFLSLLINSRKPIVMVGAMRPATSLSADGPLNLYNALAVAINPASNGRGVLVAMNDNIFTAREVTKGHTTNVDAFKAPNSGPIGKVVMGAVTYYSSSIPIPTPVTAPFSISGIKTLPEVIIIYEYAGVNGEMLDNILKTKGLKGIVIAGVGDGNIPDYEKDFLIAARNKGIVIVRSTRVGSGSVSYDYNHLDTSYNLITAADLNPQKARILLMLSLLTTTNINHIQKNFYAY